MSEWRLGPTTPKLCGQNPDQKNVREVHKKIVWYSRKMITNMSAVRQVLNVLVQFVCHFHDTILAMLDG